MSLTLSVRTFFFTFFCVLILIFSIPVHSTTREKFRVKKTGEAHFSREFSSDVYIPKESGLRIETSVLSVSALYPLSLSYIPQVKNSTQSSRILDLIPDPGIDFTRLYNTMRRRRGGPSPSLSDRSAIILSTLSKSEKISIHAKH